jgi:hypothetical protein
MGNVFDRNVLEPPPTDTVKELNFFLGPVQVPARPARPARPPAEAKR